MTYRDILKKVDHTLLKQPSTWEQIREICDDAVKYGTASVCIPPSYVKQAAEYLDGKMPVCTVIGFPNGYNTTSVKVFETKEALKDGAEEMGKLEDERREEKAPDKRKNTAGQSSLARQSGTASNEMCTFLIVNISSLQLIPINMIAYRSQYGSVSPAAIAGPALLATIASTAAGITFCKVMDRKNVDF